MRRTTTLSVLGILSCLPALHGQPVSLSISQTWTDGASVSVYLYPRADDGLPAKLATPVVTATAAGKPLTTQTVQPFESSQEGVAYILLADLSRSLSATEFKAVRQAMASFAGGLRPNDRIALITFGDDVKVKLDFSADRAKIEEAIGSLNPTDNQTKLHLAVSRAIELGQRRDAGLPVRRAIVVLTDGKDEGSGLSGDDLLNTLRSARLPVYAIGVSRLPAAEKKQYLDWLRRLSANSGGEYFDALTIASTPRKGGRDLASAAGRRGPDVRASDTQSSVQAGVEAPPSFADSYETIRKCVMGVLLARFTCTGCDTNKSETWNITVKDGDKVLTATMDHVLPAGGPPPTTETTQAPSSPQKLPVSRQTLFIAVPGGLAVILIAALAARRKRQRARTEPLSTPVIDAATLIETPLQAPVFGAIDIPIESVPAMPAAAPSPVKPTAPRSGMALRLVVVRGNKPGQSHNLRLESKASVGTNASCDLPLRSEPSLAPKEFELSLRKDRVYIRACGSGPTSVNGVPINGEHGLRDGDIIGAGGVEFRFLVRNTGA